MKELSIQELKLKLNSKKSFPIFKKKITNDELEKVFTKAELKKKSTMKAAIRNISLGFFIINLLRGDIATAIAALLLLPFSFFMKNSNKKFLEKMVKKEDKHLISAYETGLLNFYLYDGIGEISYPKTKITVS